MARPRESHVAKTLEERRLYFETIIRASASPTLEDTAPIIDPTDRPAVTEEAETLAYRPSKPPSPIRKFLREKAVELVLAVIMFIIIGFLGWGASELYRLNREVGELKSTQSQLGIEIGNVEKRLTKRVEGISSEVDRLERRIDGLMDRGSQARKNQ